jgi:hypothetical protein
MRMVGHVDRLVIWRSRVCSCGLIGLGHVDGLGLSCRWVLLVTWMGLVWSCGRAGIEHDGRLGFVMWTGSLCHLDWLGKVMRMGCVWSCGQFG